MTVYTGKAAIRFRMEQGLPCFDPMTMQQMDCMDRLNQLEDEGQIIPDERKFNDMSKIKVDSSYEVCKKCKHYEEPRDRCRFVTCGCFLNSWAKRPFSSCPQTHWDNRDDWVNHLREEFHYG